MSRRYLVYSVNRGKKTKRLVGEMRKCRGKFKDRGWQRNGGISQGDEESRQEFFEQANSKEVVSYMRELDTKEGEKDLDQNGKNVSSVAVRYLLGVQYQSQIMSNCGWHYIGDQF